MAGNKKVPEKAEGSEKPKKEQNKKVRGNGEGTVFERPDRPGVFRAVFTYLDPKTNKSKRKTFDRKSKSKALAAGREWLQQLEGGLLPDAGKITLWQWIDRWLEDYAKPKVRQKTYEGYEQRLRSYIKPYLGDVLMVKLKSPDVQRVFNNLLVSGGKEKKTVVDGNEVITKGGVSTSVVRGVRRALKMAMDQAVTVGLLTKNVVRETKPPALITNEIRPLNKEQANQLIVIAKKAGELAHIVILLALSTGMRLGEVFGLKWDCVDLERGIIHVKRHLTTTKKGQIFQEPKTMRSKRQIPIPANVVKELRKYKKWQEWQMHLMGDKYKDEGLVITNQTGGPYAMSNFTRRIFKKKLLPAAEIDNTFRFHDLRHTHATLLLLKGVNPKIVSERLGHSSVTITLDTYSHLLPNMQDAAVNAIEDVFATDDISVTDQNYQGQIASKKPG